MQYRVEIENLAKEHLRDLTARERALVLSAVDDQLLDEPVRPTRNRKPMRKNPLALWELRVGHLRVFYDVLEEPDQMVVIHAVGVKKGNRIFIGGKEMHL
jgi:mRNA-degrading endonuclease RelE of RelBE toxin-antitoxin system